MKSRLGNARPQDWPDEIRQVAVEVSERVQPNRAVVLPLRVARDVLTALQLGADAIEREHREQLRTET